MIYQPFVILLIVILISPMLAFMLSINAFLFATTVPKVYVNTDKIRVQEGIGSGISVNGLQVIEKKGIIETPLGWIWTPQGTESVKSVKLVNKTDSGVKIGVTAKPELHPEADTTYFHIINLKNQW